MISSIIHKLYIDKYVTENIKKNLCFINNQRARWGSIIFLIIALFSSLYDFAVYQKTVVSKIFLLHFKVDIILLVFTLLFLLYVFYHQVKKINEIKNQHRVIHGAISFLIILWGTVKSSLTILSEDMNYYIYFITILITSVIFYFPFIMYLSQLFFSYLLLLLTHLILDISFQSFVYNLGFIFILLMISFMISRILYYYKIKFLFKEKEISKLKQYLHNNGQEKPVSK